MKHIYLVKAAVEAEEASFTKLGQSAKLVKNENDFEYKRIWKKNHKNAQNSTRKF